MFPVMGWTVYMAQRRDAYVLIAFIQLFHNILETNKKVGWVVGKMYSRSAVLFWCKKID